MSVTLLHQFYSLGISRLLKNLIRISYERWKLGWCWNDIEIKFAVIKTSEPQSKNKNPSDEQAENKTFTLNDLEVAFIMLAVGCNCSICIFVGEIVSSRK